MDARVTRQCSKCLQHSDISRFRRDLALSEGYRSECKDCRNKNFRDWRKRPQSKQRRAARFETNMAYRANLVLPPAKHRAKKSGLEYDLDKKWLIVRLEAGKCELTGLPFDLANKRGPYAPSVDRMNPKIGYTKENCRLVLMAVNVAMGNWGLEQFVPIAEAMVRAAK